MQGRAYRLYVTRFREAREALRVGDELRLRTMCADVAALGPVDSTLSMLAMSDAESGRPPRLRSHIAGIFWRGDLVRERADDRDRSPRQVDRAA